MRERSRRQLQQDLYVLLYMQDLREGGTCDRVRNHGEIAGQVEEFALQIEL